jgi:radical SAM protein with 4Fe4S-binding SPASM domain
MAKESPYAVKMRSDHVQLWEGKPPLLVECDMELTERCNNNCIHCCINLPADDLVARSKELSTDEIKGNLRQAAGLGCLRVRFTGGEPLLRDDFEELYLYARRLGLKVILFTNGTLISPHLAKLFASIPPLEKIEITVYGMNKDSYEAVTRNPGSFEKAFRGMDLLLQEKVPFIVKMAILPPNREELAEFEAWASTIPWMDDPPRYSMFFDLRCRRDSPAKDASIKGLRLSPEQGLQVLTRRPEAYLDNMREYCSKFVRPAGSTLFSCGSGVAHGCVDAYGKFQACLLLRHPLTVYDLKNGSVKDAMEHFFPKVREITAKNPVYLARCAHCFLKGLCEQCPAKSWIEDGTLDTPVEYLCEVAHTQARYLGLLGETEMGWEVTDWRERLRSFAEEGRTEPAKQCVI